MRINPNRNWQYWCLCHRDHCQHVICVDGNTTFFCQKKDPIIEFLDRRWNLYDRHLNELLMSSSPSKVYFGPSYSFLTINFWTGNLEQVKGKFLTDINTFEEYMDQFMIIQKKDWAELNEILDL